MKRTEKETARNRLPDPPKRRPPGIGFQTSPQTSLRKHLLRNREEDWTRDYQG